MNNFNKIMCFLESLFFIVTNWLSRFLLGQLREGCRFGYVSRITTIVGQARSL